MLRGRPNLKKWLKKCLALCVWLSCVDPTLAQELAHMQSYTNLKKNLFLDQNIKALIFCDNIENQPLFRSARS